MTEEPDSWTYDTPLDLRSTARTRAASHPKHAPTALSDDRGWGQPRLQRPRPVVHIGCTPVRGRPSREKVRELIGSFRIQMRLQNVSDVTDVTEVPQGAQ